jgi:hypothetical protein
MNQIYTKMSKDGAFHEDVAEQIGFGFELPKPSVVPSVPRSAVKVEVENAVEIVEPPTYWSNTRRSAAVTLSVNYWFQKKWSGERI